MKRGTIYLFLFLIFCRTFPSYAVQQNHYFLGTYGINAVEKPTPGFNYTNLFNYYVATKLKNKHGHTIKTKGNGIFYRDLNIFSYHSGDRLFRGYYGCQLILPLINQTTEFTFIHKSLRTESGMQLSDVYFEPINITWSLPQSYLLAAYGFYIPRGRFNTFARDNIGLGNWGNQFTLACTYFVDCAKTFSISAYATYEFHTKKKGLTNPKGVDYHPGQNLCIDWGIGKTINSYLTIGIAGYAEWQTTRDEGCYVPDFVKKVKDRVFAIGPEVDISIPQYCTEFIFRYEHEFGAIGRTEGEMLIAALKVLF